MDTIAESPAPAEKTKDQKPRRLPGRLNTRTLTSHLFYGPYIWLPIIAAFVWLGGIGALWGLWVYQGRPKWRPDQASVVYISSVAGKNKAVFIPITCVVTVFYIASLVAERWLRHIDRLPTGIRKRQIIYNFLSILFAAAGGTGLVLLAIFDYYTHDTLHWSMTFTFIVCTSLSAIFQSAQVWSLHKDHPDRKSLKRNSFIKLGVIFIAGAGTVVFGTLYSICRGSSEAHGKYSAEQCNRITAGAATMEWTIAVLLVFFYLSIVGDLWPAGKSSPRYMRSLAKWQAKHEPPPLRTDFTGRGAFAAHPEHWDTPDVRAALMGEDMKARNRNQSISYNTPPLERDSEGYEGYSSRQLNATRDDRMLDDNHASV